VPTSESIVRHLPYLRRYARALTGNRAAGDAYVAATVESIIADREILARDLPVRIALYRLFAEIWNSVPVNRIENPSDRIWPTDWELSHITPLPRQACLLITLEGFSDIDAARVLNMPVAEVSRLADQCGREMVAKLATDVLIIEDEAIVATELQGLAESMGHRVIGVVPTYAESLAIASKAQPGLILSDILLADGSSGLDAVNDMLEDISAPVIFITAYPEQLLTGMRPEPAFLIAKPYRATTVTAMINHVLFFGHNAALRSGRGTGRTGLGAYS
jgi:CheY-like chemotaxis protein